MTTIADLIDQPPAAGDGLGLPFVHGAGAWRGVFQIADPSAGAGIVWHDLTDRLYGYTSTRGSGLPHGRWEATVVNLELRGVGN